MNQVQKVLDIKAVVSTINKRTIAKFDAIFCCLSLNSLSISCLDETVSNGNRKELDYSIFNFSIVIHKVSWINKSHPRVIYIRTVLFNTKHITRIQCLRASLVLITRCWYCFIFWFGLLNIQPKGLIELRHFKRMTRTIIHVEMLRRSTRRKFCHSK